MLYKDDQTSNVPNNNTENMQNNNPETEPPKKRKKKKESGVKLLIRVLIVVAIIVLGSYLVLWLVAKASNYSSIGAMLQHMFGELDLMWKRITA